MNKERFSLLLLEPNEIYFEDFSVNLIVEDPPIDDGSSNDDIADDSGWLKMCSKSIVFDPKDRQKPIIKIAYKDCDNIYEWTETILTRHRSRVNDVLAVSCSQYIEMLDRNVLAPYKFQNEKRVFLFNLHYAKLDQHLHQLCQLHRASSLHAYEQNDMIATIVYSRHKRLKFDPIWLNCLYEKILIEHTVDEINPLILNPGRLLLSTYGIYFQPYNNVQPYPVIKIPLKSITSLTKRRFLLRHTSLEIKWIKESEDEQLLYVSFRNEKEKDLFYNSLMEQESLCITKTEPESMTLKWQNGVISNYDYLLYLNSLADRTFQDLTQYPVFPWVISDYTSKELNLEDEASYRDLTKPIGALNDERLERIKDRYDEMADPKFFYGSHYSAPGLVLYYLVRKHPKLMLCLQNGRFDHPDRMFNKIDDTFNNCLNNMSDFKELIPEFYDISQKGDFLKNDLHINFGNRSDGQPVGNVQLPPWAKGSHELFVEKLREALESDYVSRNLNHWIDLIFGYKQRGEEAVQANNLFYYLCYEGSVDLDTVRDLRARHAFEIQISEFGQIPKQLFDKPHVPRIVHDGDRQVDGDLENNQQTCDIKSIALYETFQSHRDAITCVIIDDENDNNNANVLSTGKDGLLKCFSISQRKQIRSVSIGKLPLSCCCKIPNTNTVVLGCWDNTIMTYNFDYGRVSNVIPAHDDAVSALALLGDIGVLVSGSWDCCVRVWKGFTTIGCQSFSMSDSMLAYLPLEDKIASVDATRRGNEIQIIVGVVTGEVYLWRLCIENEQKLSDLTTIESKLIITHGNEITSVRFNPSCTKIVSCGLDGIVNVSDMATGMTLLNKAYANPLTCMNWSFCEEYLFMGDELGMLIVWNMLTGSIQFEISVFNGRVTCITSKKKTAATDNIIVIAGINDNENAIKIFEINF